jgi:hypothetical protein
VNTYGERHGEDARSCENSPSKTDAARAALAMVDQFCASVTPGEVEMFDIDDSFCAAHGGQQLAFWNAHHDERGFANMHIYHVDSRTDRLHWDG